MNAMPLSPNTSLDMHLSNLDFPFPGSPVFAREDSLAMFRNGTKDNTKRKQSLGAGMWDASMPDFYGFLDVAAEGSWQDRVAPKPTFTSNPPTKHQRVEQMPSSLPGDCPADFFLGSAGCGESSSHETAEDKLDKIRAKNRQAQERFRAKKKAEERAIQDHMSTMDMEIKRAKNEMEVKRQLAVSLGARCVAASTQLAHVHSDLSQLSVSKYASRRTQLPTAAPARAPLPLAAWMQSKNPHMKPEPESEVYVPALENTSSPIFQVDSSVPHPCDTFRFQERISLHHISKMPGSSALTRTKHYKAMVAHRLGCKVSDICWRLDSVRAPELTGPDGMSTHFGTVECAPKLFLAFVCSLIEYSASLLLLSRLEQDMKFFPCDDHLDPSPFISASKLPYHVPTPQRTTSDCSDSTSTNTFQQIRMDADNFCSSGTGFDTNADVPGLVDWSSPADCVSEGQATELLALSIFPKLLTSYITRMHPKEAAELCVQLSKLVQHFHAPPEEAAQLDEFTKLVNHKLLAIMKSLDAAVQHAQLGLASKSMHAPLSMEGTKRAISQIHRMLKDVTMEWHFIVLMSQMDAGRQFRTMALQICNPVGNGYIKFEERNVKAYAAINMTFEQKQELAYVWDVFKQETTQVMAAREAICQDLNSLPNHKDLNVEDMRMMKAVLLALQNGEQPVVPPPIPPIKSDARRETTVASTNQTPGENVAGDSVEENFGWMRKLIGVSPEVTEVAEEVLSSLREVQKRSTELYSEIGEVYMNVLTPEQNAIWLTVLMPALGDTFRVAEMATTDVRQQRMFHNSFCSLVHNPDEASTRDCVSALLYKAALDKPHPFPQASAGISM